METFSRLDQALVNRGIVRSRNRAGTLIRSSQILVNGTVCNRASQKVGDTDRLELLQDDHYVSRAAQKLSTALDYFGVHVSDKDCLDIGSSTGGFSQVLLERGAKRVVGIEVGHGQLAPDVASNHHHYNLERFNVRDLTVQKFRESAAENLGSRSVQLHDFFPEVVVGDVSFISLRFVVPPVVAFTKETGQGRSISDLVLLFKPQFEVGPENLSAGIVKDPLIGFAALEQFVEDCEQWELRLVHASFSPIRGTNGNIEYLIHLVPDEVRNQRQYDQQGDHRDSHRDNHRDNHRQTEDILLPIREELHLKRPSTTS